MTIQALKRDLAELKEAIKPEAPKCLVIIYDSELRGGNQDISLKCITEIQGFDITGCTQEEINEILDSVPIHFYLPKPEEDPEE